MLVWSSASSTSLISCNRLQVCDVVTINCPLHPETEHLFNATMLNKMKRGSYIVNTGVSSIHKLTVFRK